MERFSISKMDESEGKELKSSTYYGKKTKT